MTTADSGPPTTTPEESPPRTRRLRTDPSWTVRADQDLVRLRSAVDAAEVELERDDVLARRHLASAAEAVQQAAARLTGFRRRGLLDRLLSSGSSYAAVLARLQTASEELVYCQSADSLLSKVPALAGAVRTYIGPDDGRREVYLTYLQNLRDHQAGTGSPTVETGPATVGERPRGEA